MKEFLQSLSLGSGAVVVAICSAILAWPFSHVRRSAWRWICCLAVPLVIACLLYWAPVWFGSRDTDQYSAWWSLVVPIWFLSGVVSGAVVLFLLKRG